MLKQLLLGAMLVGSVAVAQDDTVEGGDHRDIPRMPGFYLSGREAMEFDAFDFKVKSQPDGSDAVTETKEGQLHKLRYVSQEGTRSSALQILRNHENALKKTGGKTVWTVKSSGEAEATFHLKRDKLSRWVYLNVYDNGGAYELAVLDEKAMQQQLEVSATEMAAGLEKNGFIGLYGITFATGKAEIQPDSEPLLEEIVSLLKQQAGLKLSIEGHTDNVGNAKANQKLSQQRAEAVRKWLVGKGVEARRLAFKGHGSAMPVADNRLEEGRAKNRRVELVKN